jgi:hypothetical protein
VGCGVLPWTDVRPRVEVGQGGKDLLLVGGWHLGPGGEGEVRLQLLLVAKDGGREDGGRALHRARVPGLHWPGHHQPDTGPAPPQHCRNLQQEEVKNY